MSDNILLPIRRRYVGIKKAERFGKIKENGLVGTSISNCLHNRSKTAGGYKWKLK